MLWAGSSPATPTVVYTYRGDGLRSTKTITTTPTITYTWDLNSSLPVVLQDGTYSYVYGLGGLISQTDITGTQTYFLGNGLGSTEKLTDGSGNIVGTYKYDIFGAVRSSSGSGSTEYRFNAQQDDATLGYTYLRARYYDPQTGRFLSKDPVRGTLTNPASQHYYTYVQNNPANYTDPSGEFLDTFLDIAFIAYDLYKIAADNVFGNCDNLDENLTALGLDAGGALVPFATGLGAASRVARAAAKVADTGQAVAGGRAFGKVLEDYASNPSNWKIISAHTERASRKGARKFGLSIQEIYENSSTRQTIVRHTVVDDAGRVVDDHFRPDYKPRVGDLFDVP